MKSSLRSAGIPSLPSRLLSPGVVAGASALLLALACGGDDSSGNAHGSGGSGGSTSGAGGSDGSGGGGAGSGGTPGTGGTASGGSAGSGGTGAGGEDTDGGAGGSGAGADAGGGAGGDTDGGAGGDTDGGAGGDTDGGSGGSAEGGSPDGEAPVVNPHAQGAEIHVNAFLPGEQKNPRVAVADDGTAIVIFVSEGQAAVGTSELWGQRFDPAGQKVGPEFQISATQASTLYYGVGSYDVAMAGDGRFVVVWSGYSSDSKLYAQRYDANGAAVGARITVDETSDEWTDYKTSVAMRDDGSFAVIYDWGYGFTVGLKMTTYAADGSVVEPPLWLTNTRRVYGVDLAVNRGGGAASYVAVWRYFDIDTEVYGRRFTEHGPTNESEFRVNTTTQGAQDNASVDVRDDGSFAVVWQSDHDGQGPSYGVFGQRFDASGAKVGSEFPLSDAPTGNRDTPGVVVGANGRLLTVWNGEGGPSPADYSEVWGRYFDGSGPIGDPFRINTFVALRQQDARVGGTADGPAWVAWTDRRQEIAAADASHEYGVYAQRLSP